MIEPKWATDLRRESDETLHTLKDGNKKDKYNFSVLARNFIKLWESTINQWDGLKAVQCLRASGEQEKAIDLAVKVEKSFPDFQRIKNLHAWCLYDINFKMPIKENENSKKVYQKSLEVLSLSPAGEFSPSERMMDRFIKWVSDSEKFDDNTLKNWLNSVNPDNLSSETEKYGKGSISQSNQEWWYDKNIGLLFNEKEYEKCIDACDKAFEKITQFSSQNEEGFFFRYRKAQCLKELERYSEIESTLLPALKIKDTWYMNLLISEAYLKRNMLDDSYEYALKAALSYGPPSKLENGWMVFLHFANLLYEKKDRENTQKLVEFCVSLRQKRDWPIPDELEYLMKKINFSVPQNRPLDHKRIYRSLKRVWENEYMKYLKKDPGEIDRVIKNKNVYAKIRSGKEFFFQISDYWGNTRELKQGFKVWIYHNPDQKTEEGLTPVAFKVTPRNAPRTPRENFKKPLRRNQPTRRKD